VNLPGVSVTFGDMVAALGAEVARHVEWKRDPAIDRMIPGWPGAWDVTRAVALGFSSEANFDEIVRAYIEDDLPSV